MKPIEAVISCFKNYANFNGRARRSEYWWFFLMNSVISAVLMIIGFIIAAATGSGESIFIGYLLCGVYDLAVIIPGFAVTCRRLHDVGKSGAYIFFVLLPVVGAILLMVWEFKDGDPWENQYGPDPKGRNRAPYMGGYGVPQPGVHAEKSAPKKSCPACGASIDADAVFCTRCGKNTVEPEPRHRADSERGSFHRPQKTCVHCKKLMDAEIKICPSCGKNADIMDSPPKTKASHRGFSAPTDLG